MRIKSKKLSHKKLTLIIATTLTILVFGGAAVFLFFLHGNLFGWQPFSAQSSSINYQKPTPEQKDAGTQTKQQSLSDKSSSTSGTDKPPTPTPQKNSKSVVEVLITAANQTPSALQIRTQIASSTDKGTCTIRLSKSGANSVTQTASVQPLATVTTCKGFDIPLSQLSTGAWHVTIHFENETLAGNVTKDITVNSQ